MSLVSMPSSRSSRFGVPRLQLRCLGPQRRGSGACYQDTIVNRELLECLRQLPRINRKSMLDQVKIHLFARQILFDGTIGRITPTCIRGSALPFWDTKAYPRSLPSDKCYHVPGAPFLSIIRRMNLGSVNPSVHAPAANPGFTVSKPAICELLTIHTSRACSDSGFDGAPTQS